MTGSRGIRNNNPGNLRPGKTPWQGQTGTDSAKGGPFLIFAQPVYGLRALARVLDTYRNRYGLTTVRGIITRWAPPTENNTAAYIAQVSKALGVSADQPLTTAHSAPLVAAIIRHENGSQPYSLDLIRQAVAMA